MPVELTDGRFEQLPDKGIVIIPGYYAGDQLRQMQEDQRRELDLP